MSVEQDNETGSSISWSTSPPTKEPTTSVRKPNDSDFQVTGDVVGYVTYGNAGHIEQQFLGNRNALLPQANADAVLVLRANGSLEWDSSIAAKFPVDPPVEAVLRGYSKLRPYSASEIPEQQYRTTLTPRGYRVEVDDKMYVPGPVPEPRGRWTQTYAEYTTSQLICRSFERAGNAIVPLRNTGTGQGRIETRTGSSGDDATWNALVKACSGQNGVMCRYDGKVGWYDIRTQIFTPLETDLPPQQDLAGESQLGGLRVVG